MIQKVKKVVYKLMVPEKHQQLTRDFQDKINIRKEKNPNIVEETRETPVIYVKRTAKEGEYIKGKKRFIEKT